MITQQLLDFIEKAENGNIRSLWIGNNTISVYVRKGYHRIINKQGQEKIEQTLDIAAVEVDEKMRGQGLFTKFLEEAHKINPWKATYVECVHNRDLALFLLRNGYVCAPGVSMESFFLLKENENGH
jgi:GNAT superfamily N-acetyltransferase